MAAAPAPAPRGLPMEILLGGSATSLACLFTNPIETVKTRMQVQGELARAGATTKAYRNAFHAFAVIARTEGIRGLQGGLAPAILYQFSMNGTRLGLYGPLKSLFASLAPAPPTDASSPARVGAPTPLLTNIAAGATSGALGAFVGSPFFMMKVRLQVQNSDRLRTAAATTSPTPAATAVVGHQHTYSGFSSGIAQVWRNEGVRGLFRGVDAAMLRVAMGSSVQLPTYDLSKSFVLNELGMDNGRPAHFVASLISGLFVTIAMNPPDVVSTRLYNQAVVNGRGQMYDGVIDCIGKIIRTEGLSAFYKGFVPHYLRLGPHTIATFMFWEEAKALATRHGF